MKKNFLAGLAILLPFTITIVIVIFIVNLLTNPFLGIVETTLKRYDILDRPFLFLTKAQVLRLSSKAIALFTLISVILLIGFLGRLVIVKTFFRLGDNLLHRIPLINRLYKITQDAVKTIFQSQQASFSHVVLVPFPNKNSLCIGLLSHPMSETVQATQLSVFVPGGLNPTMGLMLTYLREEVIFIDMQVEDALKFIISCGIMCSNAHSIRISKTP